MILQIILDADEVKQLVATAASKQTGFEVAWQQVSFAVHDDGRVLQAKVAVNMPSK